MKRERGRPPAATNQAIFEAAFELFREVGFESTTMPMIAQRVGIGRSTLFRYFSSTTAIIWYARSELTDEFRANLAAQPETVELVDGIFAAYREIWSARPELTAEGKDMMRIIETAASATSVKWLQYEAWANLVHDHVVARTGHTPTSSGTRAAAMAIWAAIWAGAVEFGLSDSDSIDEHLRRARAVLTINISAPTPH